MEANCGMHLKVVIILITTSDDNYRHFTNVLGCICAVTLASYVVDFPQKL